MCTVTITKQCTVVKVIGHGIGLFMAGLIQVRCFVHHHDWSTAAQEGFAEHKQLLIAKAANDINFAVVTDDLDLAAQNVLFAVGGSSPGF